MAISPIESITGYTGQSSSDYGTIGKDEFLLLFVTQLQNQDPLSPMDNTELASQTAQFASLEQLQNLNDNSIRLQKYQAAIFDENTISFIGKDIKFTDNTLDLKEAVSDTLHFDLPADAIDLYVHIYDSSGNLVRDLTQSGSFDAGEQSLEWDGNNNDGDPVPDGTYNFVIQSVGATGTTYTGVPFRSDVVRSVNFWDGVAYLTVAGNREISVSQVQKVTE